MRTTLTVDDDVFAAAETLAKASGQTLGKVLSGLARAGLQPRRLPKPKSGKNAFPAFPVKPDAPMISLKALRRAWEEE